MKKEELLKILEKAESKIGEDSDKKRLVEALKRSVEIPDYDREGKQKLDENGKPKFIEYLDFTLNQRINGIERAGSWFENMTEEELLEKLVSNDTKIEEYVPEGAYPGCTYLKANIPGKNGIRNIDDLPEDSPLYLSILHRGTGRLTVPTTAKVPDKDEKETTIILAKEWDHGEVMSTFHPGLPIAASDLTIDDLLAKHPEYKELLEGKEGQEVVLQITAAQAHELDFDMAKLTSDETAKNLEKNSIDVRNLESKNEISLADIRDREDKEISK